MQRLIKLGVISMVVAIVAGLPRGSEASMAWVGGRDAGIDGSVAGDPLLTAASPDTELPPTGAELLAASPLADDAVTLDPFLDTKSAEVSVASNASTDGSTSAADAGTNTVPPQVIFVN